MAKSESKNENTTQAESSDLRLFIYILEKVGAKKAGITFLVQHFEVRYGTVRMSEMHRRKKGMYGGGGFLSDIVISEGDINSIKIEAVTYGTFLYTTISFKSAEVSDDRSAVGGSTFEHSLNSVIVMKRCQSCAVH